MLAALGSDWPFPTDDVHSPHLLTTLDLWCTSEHTNPTAWALTFAFYRSDDAPGQHRGVVYCGIGQVNTQADQGLLP